MTYFFILKNYAGILIKIHNFTLLVFLILTCFQNKLEANTLIRDAEIEKTLQMIAKPIFEAADIDEKGVKVFLLDSDKLNAFIVDNDHVFFTTSLLVKLITPGMFQAILAHEVAHINSGHILKTKINIANNEWQRNLGSMLGILISSTLNEDAGIAISLGSNIAAQNNYFSNSREMEVIADTIGVKLLNEAKINPRNALKTMKLFEDLEKIMGLNDNQYISTHPASTQRIQNIKVSIKQLEPQKYLNEDYLNYRYQRILAKVSAYSERPEKTLHDIDKSNLNELNLIKKAIASHLKPDPKTALDTILKLVKIKPNDPYFRELLGQIYLETGNPQKAINAFSKASKILPDEPAFLIWSAISHLALENTESNEIALKMLQNAIKSDTLNPNLLRHLSIAYARNNQMGKAALKSSEYCFILGQFDAAKMHAKQALNIVKPHSIEWQKAKDIIRISSKFGEND